MADLSEPEAGEGEACCAPCHRSSPAALPCSATLGFSQVFWLAASPDHVGFCFLLFAFCFKVEISISRCMLLGLPMPSFHLS